MNKLLESYTREELENKLLHMVEFIAFQLATEFIQLTEPTAALIRTPEAEIENTERIKQLMVCVFPAWGVLQKVHPAYEYMDEWVKSNQEISQNGLCVCSGCTSARANIN